MAEKTAFPDPDPSSAKAGRFLRKARGDAGEAAVARFLQPYGFTLLARQYKVPGIGELDLVMSRGDCLYFIEVKARTDLVSFGDGLAQITPAKIMRLRRAAAAYCQDQAIMNSDIRFLAAEVHLQNGRPTDEIRIVSIF